MQQPHIEDIQRDERWSPSGEADPLVGRYILLNLFLSMMAGVQAAGLLIAAKRSDAVASEIAIHAEHNTEDIKNLIDQNLELIREVKRQTDLLEEIHRHVAALAPGAGQIPPRPESS